MLKYCPECGNKLEEGFKFCPTCGKNLTGEFAFCPECGKKMILSEKRTVLLPEKRKTFKVKKRKSKITFPKLSLHIPRKTAIAIAAIVCAAAVVGATVIVLSPFDTTGVQSAGRIFTITVENTFGSDAECYLKVGALKHGETFTVSGVPKTINIEEDNLFSGLLGSNYNITLYATINDITIEATADAVTESASFLISESTVIGEHQVECTVHQ